MNRAIAGLALALTMCAAGATDAARRGLASPRVAIVPLSSNGTGAAGVAAGVTRAMVSSLRPHCQVTVLDESRAARLRLCLQQPSCAQALGQKFGWTVLIAGHVEQQGSGFQLDLRALSGRTGEVVGSEARRLGSPQDDRVGGRLALRLVARARSARPSGRPGGVVTDSEAEAAAAIRERGDGENPLAEAEEKPASGPALKATVEVERPVPREPVSFGRRYWPSITAGAVGVAALSAAAIFGGYVNDSVSQARDPDKTQVEAFQLRDKAQKNAMMANILFGVGGAALAVSAVLLAFEIRAEILDSRARRRSRSSSKVALDIAPGGVSVCARGEF